MRSDCEKIRLCESQVVRRSDCEKVRLRWQIMRKLECEMGQNVRKPDIEKL